MLYPVMGFAKPGELSNICGDVDRSTGGAVCNNIMDLASLDPEMPLVALGRIGDDAQGAYVMEKLQAFKNIDVQHIKVGGTTAFSLVLADEITKQRTFYECSGVNASFCEEDIPWDKLDVDMLHIGYILLLDALDQEDSQYGTKMAKLLHTAQQRGIKTSIDVVSETGERFRKLVCPALRYTDYCVINEVEASATTGIELRAEDGTLLKENFPAALRKLKEMGVSTWAVIHCPEVGMGLDENDNLVEVPSLKLPKGWIAGTVGAGDAFCSGVTYAAWKGEDLKSAIELGTASAVCSLSQPGSTEGMRTEAEARALYESMR
jgi:sugar/nucleoside kinase (ribokinase family)